ncbi:dihydrolipoamide acetyltransferase family protein [Asticcacaulis sp.]|uniref:dihydrolipoamide acetyltransferase family protein n=1 Tax=Asticcacaulis sp. TaxID=1872648 RepID=UPI002BBECC31|nr:dihydrolipoamide acetyltransferase family protein [Asticcacaulis sp.]HTM81339.1 dihydrolipoamide acetyltransferase family protein [Asticcacaulis sp.]
MGLYLFRLPDVGEGVAEAEIGSWYVKAGDVVQEDAPLVDVLTDKASVEITSPVTGKVLAVHGATGDFAPVGSVLVELEVEGQGEATPTVAQEPAEPLAPPVTSPAASKSAPLAAPATRHRADEMGVSLSSVTGSGPEGRVLPDDLDAYAQPESGPAPVKSDGVTEIRIVGLRRKIAEKMQAAKRNIPHFAYVEEFDLTNLEGLRKELNDSRGADQPKLTLLPFFMLAVAKLRSEFPNVNARYDDEAGILRAYDAVHIGIATQTPNGLVVPVVRHVEALDLWGCARELARVTKAARDGTASREELSGSTITLTSLGALGGIAATPVINAPEVAILGPNKLVDRPVVQDGQVVIRTLMNLSSSFDHRIIDGFDAASYVQRLKRLIEKPALLFIG